MPDLTRRQLQILALLGVGGLSPPAIQERLGVNSSTYHQHINGAKKCMRAKTIWQLMYLAGLQIAQELEEAEGVGE
jgi:DNA-binding CsgD family transcriptional regulator